jgi:hypothetical protein
MNVSNDHAPVGENLPWGCERSENTGRSAAFADVSLSKLHPMHAWWASHGSTPAPGEDTSATAVPAYLHISPPLDRKGRLSKHNFGSSALDIPAWNRFLVAGHLSFSQGLAPAQLRHPHDPVSPRCNTENVLQVQHMLGQGGWASVHTARVLATCSVHGCITTNHAAGKSYACTIQASRVQALSIHAGSGDQGGIALKRVVPDPDEDVDPDCPDGYCAGREVAIHLALGNSHRNIVTFHGLSRGSHNEIDLWLEQASCDLGRFLAGWRDPLEPPTVIRHDHCASQTHPSAAGIRCCGRALFRTDRALLFNLVLDLVEGVQYIHGMDFVHRDLKPGNILVQPDNVHGARLVICDFGLTTHAYSEAPVQPERTDRVVTAPYRPPEIWEAECGLGNRRYDGKQVDVWSMGIILLELMAGTRLTTGCGSALRTVMRSKAYVRRIDRDSDSDNSDHDTTDQFATYIQTLGGDDRDDTKSGPDPWLAETLDPVETQDSLPDPFSNCVLIEVFGVLVNLTRMLMEGQADMLAETLQGLDDLVDGEILNPTQIVRNLLTDRVETFMDTLGREFQFLFSSHNTFAISSASAVLARTGVSVMTSDSVGRQMIRWIFTMLHPITSRPRIQELGRTTIIRFLACYCKRPFIGAPFI